MSEFLWIVYVILCTTVPTLLIYFFTTRSQKDHGIKDSSIHIKALILLAIYLGLVFYVTGSGSLYDLLRTGFEYRPEQINLVPLLLDSYTMQYVLNIVLFIPFGILFPLAFPPKKKAYLVLGYGFALSLFIELSQLLNMRASDVDDLIMNTLGALIGYALLKLFTRKKSASPQPRTKPYLAACYLTAMALGYFFLYNGLGLAVALNSLGVNPL